MQILIAEDEMISRTLLDGLLRDWGYETITACDGHAAWEILQQESAPPLAILDWTMPGIDGIEICRMLREKTTPTPIYVILLTGRTSKIDLVAGLAAGANDYIVKPYDADELRARIQVGQTVSKLQRNVAQRMREFQDYVEDAPLGIIVVEHDGIIAFANRSADSIFGYPHGELLGQPIEVLLPTQHRDRHISLRKDYNENPHLQLLSNRELLGRRKDNSEVPVAVGLNTIRREKPIRVVSTVMDLTQLYDAREEQDRFFNISLDLFCIAQLTGPILRVNDNVSQLLGHSIETILAHPFTEYISPDDLPLVDEQVRKLAEGDTVAEFRCRLRDSHGCDHWIEWNARAVLEKGTFYAVGRNITDRLRMEKELANRELRERAILNNIPSLIYVKGLDGRYEFVNRRHAELFSGGDLQKVVGKTTQELHPEIIAAGYVADDQKIIDTAQKIVIEEIIRHGDEDHHYLTVKFPLFDLHDEVCAIAGISTDISDQVRHRVTAQELRIARSFQTKLYPVKAPEVEGIDVSGSAIPLTDMSGDYFDYIRRGPGRLMVTIGDVSGHGIGPALQMTEARAIVRTLARLVDDLPTFMTALNNELCDDLPDSTFISFFLADIDVPKRRINYVGAGHDAFLIRADGTVINLESTHMVLGVHPGEPYQQIGSVAFDPGDLLYLFTDGLSDARNVHDQEFGRKQAVEVVAGNHHEKSESILTELLRSVFDFTAGRNPIDDITAVVVKMLG